MNRILRKLRRKYFLPDSSQPRLLLGIELIFFILLVISGFIFYLVANQDLTASYYQAHLKINNLRNILLPTLIALNLAGLIVGAVLALFFTHRIAGPLYRLSRIMRNIGTGNLDHVIKFRKGDEMKEMERATETMLLGLNQRIQTIKKRSDHLEELAKTDAAPTALREEISRLQQALSDFVLSEEGG